MPAISDGSYLFVFRAGERVDSCCTISFGPNVHNSNIKGFVTSLWQSSSGQEPQVCFQQIFLPSGFLLAIHTAASAENPGQGCGDVLGKVRAWERCTPKICLQAMQSAVSSCARAGGRYWQPNWANTLTNIRPV